MTILSIDPGESTGWVTWLSGADRLQGGTIKHNRKQLWNLLTTIQPAIIVFEEFVLYPTHAKSLIWNTFYTCEIIGIIKLYVDLTPNVKLVKQSASNKKYSGAKSSDELWQSLIGKTTNHTFDAYIHLVYYLRTNKRS